MRAIGLFTLMGALTLVGGCFDRDNNHPGKDSDASKPSLQMQQPDEHAAPRSAPAPEPMTGHKANQ
nr:hypothetical protein [uncultured Pseudomonas sp.]